MQIIYKKKKDFVDFWRINLISSTLLPVFKGIKYITFNLIGGNLNEQS